MVEIKSLAVQSLRIFLLLILSMLATTDLHPIAQGQNLPPCKFLRMDWAPRIKGLAGSQEISKYLFQFDGNVKVNLCHEVGIPLVYLDILGGSLYTNSFVSPISTGPVRLVRINRISATPPVLRVTLFLRELLKPQIKSSGQTIEVVFLEENASNRKSRKEIYDTTPS